MRALHGPRVAPELGDMLAILVGDAHIVDAGPALPGYFPRGGGQPIAVQSPYLTLNWCVALNGVYPSRN